MTNNKLMIDRFIDPNSLIGSADDRTRSLIWMFAVSALGHLIFFLILILIPTQLPAKRYTPSAISVRMVSPPGSDQSQKPGPAAVAPKPDQSAEPAKPIETSSEVPTPAPIIVPPTQAPTVVVPEPAEEVASSSPEPETVKPDTISVAPKKKKVKTSLKKKTYRSARVIKKAVKRIEKKTQVARPNTVKEAIERLRSEVSKTEELEHAKQSTDETAEPEPTGGGGGGGSGTAGIPGGIGRQVLEKIDLYKLEIAYMIEKKWAFSEQLASGRTDLEAVIVIKILPNGEIRDIWFEKKSGNSYFDESAVKAVRKSNPLPPLPKEYRRPFYDVGLVFTPSGLRKGRS